LLNVIPANRALHVIQTLPRTLMRVRQSIHFHKALVKTTRIHAVALFQFRKTIKAEKEDKAPCSRPICVLDKQAQQLINPNNIQDKLIH